MNEIGLYMKDLSRYEVIKEFKITNTDNAKILWKDGKCYLTFKNKKIRFKSSIFWDYSKREDVNAICYQTIRDILKSEELI